MWNIEVITNSDDGSGFTVLKLPSATRNISTKMNKSTSCVLSAKNVYAIAGKSKLLKYGFCKKLLRYNDDLEKSEEKKGQHGILIFSCLLFVLFEKICSTKSCHF